MDGERFDAITKAVGGTITSRRGALRLLGGGALGGILSEVGRDAQVDARKRCRKVGQRCHRHNCCSGHCGADTSGYRSCRIAACVPLGGACNGNLGNTDCCQGGCVYYVATQQSICSRTL
jgi:hypothetical protein